MGHPEPIGLSGAELSSIFPFHVGFDAELQVLQLGPALRKLAPGITLGRPLTEFFGFDPPLQPSFEALVHAHPNLAVLRAVATGAQLRGQFVPHASGRTMLFLCSPWLTSTSELHRLGLRLTDFALHDPMADLLQVLQAQDAALADVRKLVTKLSAQRKEQRAASTRMAALYEITRTLAEGGPLEAVAPPVLEGIAEIMKVPVAALWLYGSSRRHVHVRADAPSHAHALAQRLGDASRGVAQDLWLATSRPQVRCLSPGAEGPDGVGLELSVAYQVQIEGGSEALGAFEVYGSEAPSQERARLDTVCEVALRFGQYVAKVRADEALRNSMQVAAAAAAAKGQFLARMSHEIRTPINGVLGMLELVLSSSLGERERAQLQAARSSGELLLGLVNDVLDFSKIEAGHLEMNPVPFDLHACLRRAHGLFKSRAEGKQIGLHLVMDDDVPEVVVGDELRISQVLVNLLGNAVKFTKAGAVTLEVHVLDEQDDASLLGFMVRDTGIGIPESRREQVFSAFTQAEASTAREFGGTGLGLAICKQLVELMDGELTVSSVLGEGSTFFFSVRVGHVAELDLVSAPAVDQVAACGPLHILVVEDNEINQQVARGLLERDGHLVELASTMEAAIARGCEGAFDAILMDVQLPDGDGLTATIAIRNHARRVGQAAVPIIGLSAQAVAGDRERALGVGMDEYLTKPIRPAQLVRVLAALGGRNAGAARGRRATSIARGARVTTAAIAKLAERTAPPAPLPEAAGWSPQDEQGFLAKLEEYGDLGDLIFRLASALVAEAPKHLADLLAGITHGDTDGLRFLSHRLVGSAGTIGFLSLHQATIALETALREGRGGALEQELAELRAAFAALARFVASESFSRREQQARAGAGLGAGRVSPVG